MDTPTPSASDENKPSTSSGITDAPVFSRRRMAFRSTTASAKLSAAEAQAAEALINLVVVPEVLPTQSIEQQSAEERKTKPKTWTHEDIMVFYEALKHHGKDFDSVAKALAKRKVSKDKDQIKNYFYNSLKIIKNVLSIDDEQMGDVPKDARELFLALNACEWKKRTSNMKFVNEKMKELLFEGVTVVRINKKSVFIRTPACPSLARFFTRERKAEKFPADLHIVLKPKSHGDAAALRTRSHNPLLKVKMKSNDKIMKLFELLQKKWNQGEHLKTWQYRIRLFPSANVEVGSLRIRETDVSPHICLSMNKLVKELEITKSEKKPSNPLNVVPAAENIKTDPVYSCIYPRPFAITDKLIKTGITMRNCGNVIAAELFLVCGMKDSIELCYEIECDRLRDKKRFFVEPWRSVCELIARDYGDTVSSARKEENDLINAALRKKEKELEESRKPTITVEPPPKKVRSEPIAVKDSCPARVYHSQVVQAENEEFAKQLMMLNPAKVSKARPVVNLMRPTVQETPSLFNAPVFRVPALAIKKSIPSSGTPPTTESSSSDDTPIVTCQMIPKHLSGSSTPNKHENKILNARKMTPKKNVDSPRTDFSGITLSPIKTKRNEHFEDLQKARNDDFFNSLKTPTKTPTKKSKIVELFGDELSLSPSQTRKSMPPPPAAEEDVSRCELTDILFGEISLTPSKFTTNTRDGGGNGGGGGGGGETQSGLGFSDTEVHQSYDDMLNSSQDSRDFVLEHFKPKMEKKRRS